MASNAWSQLCDEVEIYKERFHNSPPVFEMSSGGMRTEEILACVREALASGQPIECEDVPAHIDL